MFRSIARGFGLTLGYYAARAFAFVAMVVALLVLSAVFGG